jgi:hypothetical protein
MVDWKAAFEEGKELIFATSSKNGTPHANMVESLGFYNDKLLIADCMMNVTIKNIQETGQVCIVGGYYRITGTVELFTSGKIYDLAQQKTKGYKVKHAILVKILDVFDLYNAKII